MNSKSLAWLKTWLFVIACFYCISSIRAGQVETLVVHSAAMDKEVPNLVILPDNYNESTLPFPVIYLLHGAGVDYSQWIRVAPELPNFCDRYNVIIVLPDAGVTSWYFDSPIDPKFQYETYVTGELVSRIDEKYNTVADRSGRAISGLSMGGHGALYLAARHPEIFGAAGSTSGGVDFTPFPENWDIAKRLGPYKNNVQRWQEHTVVNMTESIKDANLALIIDCGIDDFFLEGNRLLHRRLLQQRVPHDYIERPGGHTGDYWHGAIEYQVLFFFYYFQST